MTVTDQDGKTVLSRTRVYEVRNLHFRHNKEGYLGLDHWDITAMDQVNLGIRPHETDTSSFIIPLPEGTTSVDVEAMFNFIYEKGHSSVIHRKIEKVRF